MAGAGSDLNLVLHQLPTDNGSANRYSARIRTGGGSKVLKAPVSTLSAALTHVVYLRDAQGEVHFYINGLKVADRDLVTPFVPWDPTFPLILANNPANAEPWFGQFHLLAFYNRTLSPAEIGQNFGAGPTGDVVPTLTGFFSLYDFEENGGTMVHDVSGVGTALDLQVANAAAVSWLPGALSVDSATDISSAAAATKLADAVNSTTELTLEAWVAPASDNQPQPGSIANMAGAGSDLNLVLHQLPTDNGSANRYSARIRTGGGSKVLKAPVSTLSAALTHVVYLRDAQGEVHFYINGLKVADRDLVTPFVPWDPTFPLILANNPANAEPWFGQFHLLAFYNRTLSPAEIGQHFLAGP